MVGQVVVMSAECGGYMDQHGLVEIIFDIKTIADANCKDIWKINAQGEAKYAIRGTGGCPVCCMMKSTRK